jgi:hypothetical protein
VLIREPSLSLAAAAAQADGQTAHWLHGENDSCEFNFQIDREPTVYTVYDRMFGDFPAEYPVHTPFIVSIWFWPT